MSILSGPVSEVDYGCAELSKGLFANSSFETAAVNVSQSIYLGLIQDIFTRKRERGEQITEAGVAKEYHVSTIPVREAFLKLEREGWIERSHNKRTFISKYGPEKLRELYQLRKVLEIGVFYSLAHRITEKQFIHLESLVADVDNAYNHKQVQAYREADLIYHCTAVFFACGRQGEKIYENILLKCLSFVDYPADPDDFMKYPLETHQPSHHSIQDALHSQDLAILIPLVEQHVLSGAKSAGIDI